MLTKLLAGFPLERLHIASFDTFGTVHRPKAPTRAGVEHMLSSIQASGGTLYASGVRALHRAGLRLGPDAKLVVIAVGDEAGENGHDFAKSFAQCGYPVSAMALVVNVAVTRGTTVRVAAEQLDIPFTEVTARHFDDPYQVPRVLGALLEVPRQRGVKQYGLVERVMNTPLLTLAS